MGFWQQLRVLLWKNFLLKKRSPVVSIVEAVLPLLMFAILIVIRTQTDTVSHNTEIMSAYPLPSAGFVPLVQLACPAGNKDENGFISQDKSLLYGILDVVRRLSDLISGALPNDNPATATVTSFLKAAEDHMTMKNIQGDAEFKVEDIEKVYRSIHGVTVPAEVMNQVTSLKETIDYVTDDERVRFPEFPEKCERPENISSSQDMPDDSTDINATPDEILRDIEVIWRTLSRIVCNLEEVPVNDDFVTSYPPVIEIGDTIRELIISNPRILYAPTNTQADSVVRQVLGTIGIIPEITRQALLWLELSQEIRDAINRTIYDPVLLQKHSGQKRSSTVRFTTLPGVTQRPVRSTVNPRLPISNVILGLLDVVDWLACSWMNIARDYLSFAHVFRGFRTEKEMEEYFLHKATDDGVSVLASVVFEVNGDGTLPPQAVYKIRQNATFTPTTRRARSLWYQTGPEEASFLYYLLGFVWLQDLVERAIMTTQLGFDVVEPGLFIQAFPQPCYIEDSYSFIIEHMMPLALVLGWLLPVAMLIRAVLYEKEHRLREVTRMMGVTSAAHWTSWYISALLQATVLMAILTIMLKLGNILTYSNGVVIFVIVEIFAINAVCYSFFITVIFRKTKVAAAVGGIMFFVTYVPYMYIAIVESVGQYVPIWGKCLASLMGTTSLGLLCKYLGLFEGDSVGLQWDNLMTTPMNDQVYNPFISMMMSLGGSLVYVVLVWYIDNVFPGDYGLPKPWYFFVTQSYWCGRDSDTQGDDSRSRSFKVTAASRNVKLQNFERDPQYLRQTISIKHLTKVYGSKKTAVDGLNLNLYEGQILSFLGHNGAGKTTTMSMLTGMIPMTSGHVTIYDMNIQTQIERVRNILGFCPQHNVLFDSLSVYEHLKFYASIKGLSRSDIEEEAESMLADVGLTRKRNAAVSTLSGGMKRKLSIAIAFISGSRVIILDEPTAGVDPFSRREIWDLLLKYKHGRTIMLSTHHMDEADVLGDRIAVISEGVLLCCGSSLFLKSTLGEGYHLNIVKATDSSPASTSTDSLPGMSNTQRITGFLQNHVTECYLKNENVGELQYILPFSGLHNGQYAALFQKLDRNLSNLGIQSYGVSDTQLEEVFLRVIREAKESENDAASAAENTSDTGSRGDSTYSDASASGSVVLRTHRRNRSEGLPLRAARVRTMRRLSWDSQTARQYMQLKEQRRFTKRQASQPGDGCGSYVVTGPALILQQFEACFIKRLLLFARSWKPLIVQIFLPVVFVAIAMVMAIVGGSDVTDEPPIVLSPAQYLNLSKYAGGHFVPIADERQYSSSVDADVTPLIDTLRLASGLSADCSLRSPFLGPNSTEYSQTCFDIIGSENFEFKPSYDYQEFDNESTFYPSCQCAPDGTDLMCSDGQHREPPSFSVITRDIIQNMTSSNLTEFLLNTDRRYRQSRYGALSFGVRRKHVPEWLAYLPLELGRIIVGKVAKVLYHTHGYHSMPIFINAVNNAVLRANVPPLMGNPAGYGIVAINHPMKGTTTLDYTSSTNFSLGGAELITAIFITLGLAFVPAAVSLGVVHEVSVRAVHLQTVSGLRTAIYWISNILIDTVSYAYVEMTIAIFVVIGISFIAASMTFTPVEEVRTGSRQLLRVAGQHPVVHWTSTAVIDLVLYQLPAWICVGVFRAFNIQSFTADDNFPCIIAIFILYGVGTIPMTYLSSFYFREPSAAFVFLSVFNTFTGVMGMSVLTILRTLGQEHLIAAASVMENVFLIFPGFAFGNALMNVAINHVLNQFNDLIGGREYKSPMDFDITGKSLVAMTTVGVVCFILTLFAEYSFFIPTRVLPDHKLPTTQADEDADVARERRRVVTDHTTSSDVVRLKNLTKIYGSGHSKKNVAVNRLCLGIPSGECFGMLGVNGAGKTTTFKMLTGDHAPSGGTAHIANYSILKEIHQVRQRIGYCPQFDALFDEMTAREHLYLYARLRGIPRKDLKSVVNWAIDRLELKAYATRLVGTYSGGNKRKLSTAIALLGKPQVIFLDEPTAGMDPYAKRFLWNLILRFVSQGRSVVLTSHSMEECETLCDRLAIMVDGQFRCLGSVQHLKNQFGEGYTIKVTVKGKHISRRVSDLKAYMSDCLPMARFKEQHYRTVHYEVKGQDINLSLIFSKMEEARRNLALKDYSVCQNTLDTVFISFVEKQKEDRRKFRYSSDFDDAESDVTNVSTNAIAMTSLDDIAVNVEHETTHF